MAAKKRGKPFTPGDKRINRKGRPRTGESTAEILRAKLDQTVKGKTRRENIAEALITKAEGGDVPAARTVIERVEGRPLTPLTFQGSGYGMFGPCTERDPEKLKIIFSNLSRRLPDLLKGTNGAS